MLTARKTVQVLFAVPAAALSLSGCSGDSDANTYAIAIADAKARIGSAQSEYQSGSQTRTMRPAGPSENGVRVHLSKAGTFSSSCLVRFEEVDAGTTRIIPDCGDTGAATSDAAAEFFELEIAAHVRQMLTGEPVNGEELGKKMAMVTLKNLPKMQSEGFKPDEEWVEERKDAAVERVRKEADGWGDDASTDYDGGWADE